MTLLFALGGFLVDRAAGGVLGYLLSSTSTGEGSGQPNALFSVAQERQVLFFGSSRCRQHFDPAVFAEHTGLDGYNAGANGQGVHYAAILASVLAHRGTSAQLMVLHLDPDDVFAPRPARARVLLPWVDESDALVPLLEPSDRFLRLKLWSHAYRYNSMALPILRNVLFPTRPSSTGFEPRVAPRAGVGPLPEPNEEGARLVADASRRDWHPEGRAAVRTFLASVRRVGAEAVFATAPLHIGVRGPALVSARDAARERARELVAELAREEGVRYFSMDERRHPALRDPSLFNDPGHLNPSGARLLTELLAQEMVRAE